ncbi:MAG: hypothetical protein AAF547_09625 [Actinomycetota bacterium]
MTDDELDALASAYLDGEATPEEVALVERDPALLARVEELRAVGDLVAQPPAGPGDAVRAAQLAAAMAAFDDLGLDGTADPATAELPATPVADAVSDDPDPGGAPVVDLASRSRKRAQTNGAVPARTRRMPAWLPAAAVFVLIGGGLLFIAGQSNLGGSDDSGDETATADFATEEAAENDAVDSGDAAGQAARAESLAESAPAAAEEEVLEEAEAAIATDDAMEDDAMEEEAMADEAAEDADAEAQELAGDGGDFVPENPILLFTEFPDLDRVLDDIPAPRNAETSNCLADLEIDEPLDPVGYLPVEVTGIPAELFVIANPEDGVEIALLLDVRTCAPLEP